MTESGPNEASANPLYYRDIGDLVLGYWADLVASQQHLKKVRAAEDAIDILTYVDDDREGLAAIWEWQLRKGTDDENDAREPLLTLLEDLAFASSVYFAADNQPLCKVAMALEGASPTLLAEPQPLEDCRRLLQEGLVILTSAATATYYSVVGKYLRLTGTEQIKVFAPQRQAEVSAPGDGAPAGDWLPGLSLKEMAERLNLPTREKVKVLLGQYGLKPVGDNRQMWTVRLDIMPRNYRQMLTKP